jgi:phosphonate transport system substrate-binding protein
MILALLLATGPLHVAVPAPLGVAQARQDAAGIAQLFSELLDRPVAGQVAPKGLPQLIAGGQVEMAWLSASEYLEASSKAKVIPVAKLIRGGLPFYRSVLFTRKGAFKRLTDLKGKRFAFVSERSSAGYVLARRILVEAGFTPTDLSKATFLGDHAAVCKAVLDGEADAGATFANDGRGGQLAGCLETAGQDKAAQLHAMVTSDPIPNDVIVLKPGSPDAQVTALRSALLSLRDPHRMELLFHADGFAQAADSDFEALRALSR